MENVEKGIRSESSWRRRKKPVALELDESGIIQKCSDDSEILLGYSREELFRHHISELLPQFARIELFKQGKIDPRLDFLCHFGHFFQVQRRDGDSFLSELHLFSINKEEYSGIRLLISPC
jgi:PAS domain S-box-containing protein